MDDDAVALAAIEVGFPVLLKPSAGGGGKGMRVVRGPDELAEQIAGARREARGSFGDDTLLVERYLGNSRHIEVQVFGDAHGTVVHLGERECSLQRRHQKVIEEAPSPLLTTGMRARMGGAAVEAARAVGYTGAGTVEFIVDADHPDDFFFLEMNTRLQVEHPVTECVTGLDLVELQVRVAAGERLPIEQADVVLDGHAIEARVYAEDPARGFLPQAGTVLGLIEPTGPGVRVDSSLAVGTVVGSDYDPMLAKVIAWAPTRETARARLVGALGHTAVLGDRKSTRLNSSHANISYAVFCLKKKKNMILSILLLLFIAASPLIFFHSSLPHISALLPRHNHLVLLSSLHSPLVYSHSPLLLRV